MLNQPYSLDYQVHSFRSHDGHASISDYCKHAVRIGLKEIGFSEHKDFDLSDEFVHHYDEGAYSDELQSAQAEFGKDLVIRKGVEIDYQAPFEKEIKAFLAAHPFDFVMGNVHFVEGVMIMSEAYNAGKTREEAYSAYFEAVLASVKSGLFDFVGHLEYCNRRGIAAWGEYSPEPFRKNLSEIFREMIARSMTLEFNTGGLHRGVGVTLPTLQTMTLYYELGGRRLTFGSDAHRTEHLAHELDWAYTELRKIGDWKLVSFEHRTPIERDL